MISSQFDQEDSTFSSWFSETVVVRLGSSGWGQQVRRKWPVGAGDGIFTSSDFLWISGTAGGSFSSSSSSSAIHEKRNQCRGAFGSVITSDAAATAAADHDDRDNAYGDDGAITGKPKKRWKEVSVSWHRCKLGGGMIIMIY